MSRRRRSSWPWRRLLPMALSVCLGGASHAETLRVCLLEDDLPRSDRGASGFDQALAIELARAVDRDLEIVWRAGAPPFAEIDDTDLPIDALVAGRCDLAMSIPGRDALGRAADEVALTRPYYGAAFELLGDEAPSGGLRALRGRKVAVRLQSLGHYALQAVGVDWVARPTEAEIVAAWRQGEADAALVWGPELGAPELRALHLRPAGGWEPDAALRFNEHLAVRAGEPELLAAIDAALAELLGKGAVADLLTAEGVPQHAPFAVTSSRQAMWDLEGGSGRRISRTTGNNDRGGIP